MHRLALIAALSLTTVAAPVFAGSALAGPADMATRSVRVSDLDLASAAGQATLRHRIGRAVEAVCGSYATTAEPSTQDAIGRCRAQVGVAVDRQIAARARTGTAIASAR